MDFVWTFEERARLEEIHIEGRIILKEISSNSMDWIRLVKQRDQWQAFAYMEISFLGPWNRGNIK